MGPEILVAGIELGGTKTLVAVGRADGTVLESKRLPTTGPEPLIEEIARFLSSVPSELGSISALGVGAFGPVVVNPTSKDFGRLLDTNKGGWSGFDLLGALKARIDVPTSLMTDVAAAGLGEAARGNLRDIELGLYITVGTGIGGALIHRGNPLAGLLHPELGHLPLVRLAGDQAPSTCSFHENCAEGLVAGPAISTRLGQPLSGFVPGGTEYALVADYLGQLLASMQLACSPERIVLGGGVSQAAGLLEQVEVAMRQHLGDYASYGLDQPGFLVAPRLGGDAAITGALIAAGKIQRELLETGKETA